MSYDYLLCSWRVRSDLELPQLLPWTGPDRDADITIARGEVPELLDNAVSTQRWWMVDANDTILLTIPGLVRFLVREGRSVTVEILRSEAAQGWRLFLLGTVLNYLCHQRGLFPLHAATLKIGGCNIAIAGHSGTGKSTLAGALMQRGHGLLSDDVTVLETASPRNGWVLPAFPRLKLWYDSCRALGIDPITLPRVRDSLDKIDYGQNLDFDPTPGPLEGIVILNEGEALGLEPQAKTHAVPSILDYVARPGLSRILGRGPALFAQAAILSSQVEVVRLTRPKKFDLLQDTAVLIEEHFRS
jgi:hypothetical protein